MYVNLMQYVCSKLSCSAGNICTSGGPNVHIYCEKYFFFTAHFKIVFTKIVLKDLRMLSFKRNTLSYYNFALKTPWQIPCKMSNTVKILCQTLSMNQGSIRTGSQSHTELWILSLFPETKTFTENWVGIKSKFYKKCGATFFYDITRKLSPLDFTQYMSKSSSF